MHILLNKSLSHNLTGIEHSSLNRFNLLKGGGFKVCYATLNFNIDLENISKGYGISSSEILNPYYFFLKQDEFNAKDLEFNFDGLKTLSLKNGDLKVFRNNELFMYIGYDVHGKLRFINHFRSKFNFKREFYFNSNKILEIIFNSNKTKNLELYYNYKGDVVLERKYCNDGLNVSYIELNFLNSKFTFRTEVEFLRFWLSYCLKEFNQCFLYIDRPFRYNEILFNLDLSKFKVIGVIHAIHYNHYRSHMVGNLMTGYKGYFDNIDKLDAIIVGTQLQKNDIVDRFGIEEYIHVIPPSSLRLSELVDSNKNEKLTFISVGRLSPEKRIDHLLKAFRLVKESGFHFEFNIFGVGPELLNLQKMVVEYGLSDLVEFKGYSKNILNEINKANFSLIASAYEGFNISIIESFHCATPVISYDVKYGPRELIKDGYNGFLIEDNNIEMFSKKIIELIENPLSADDLYENSYKSSLNFSENFVAENWKSLIESI